MCSTDHTTSDKKNHEAPRRSLNGALREPETRRAVLMRIFFFVELRGFLVSFMGKTCLTCDRASRQDQQDLAHLFNDV